MADPRDTTTGLGAASSPNALQHGVPLAASTEPPVQSAPAAAAVEAPDLPEPVILEEHVVLRGTPPPAPRTPVPAAAPAVPESVIAPTSLATASALESAPRAQPESGSIPGSAKAAGGSAAARNDIMRILEDVKLPNRPEFHASADTNVTEQIPVPTPRAVPAPAAGSAGETAPRDGGAVVALHTLKDDLQSVVRDKKISLVRAAALEEDKRHRRDEAVPPEEIARASARRRLAGTIVAILSLLALGAGALAAVYVVMQQRSGANTSPVATEGLIFSEQSVSFSLGSQSPGAFKRALSDARLQATLTLGAIARLVPVVPPDADSQTSAPERTATFHEFLAALGAQAPDELVRALSDEFFFGFHTVDENAPVLVIPVASYEHAFAGMLAWEKTMNADLAPIFTAVPAVKTDARGLLVERVFEDAIMRNYDVRVLKDDAGAVQLYYSFPTRGILIIAESPYSFTEVLSRLRADRKI